MDEIPAKVHILDREYKIKVKPDDEEFLRKAAELIDHQARGFAKMYAYNDRQDLLAMVSLTQITRLMKLLDQQAFCDTRLEAKLTEISQLLDTE